MIRTRITEEYGLSAPICCAGMAIIAMPALAAAVSNAGGLGVFGTGGRCTWLPIARARTPS